MTDDRSKILSICQKLNKERMIVSIEEKDYTIDILINYNEMRTSTAYEVRDRIKSNFEKMGYIVRIGGAWWLKITYYDVAGIIDNCFDGDAND